MSKTQGYEFYSFYKFVRTPKNPYKFVLTPENPYKFSVS